MRRVNLNRVDVEYNPAFMPYFRSKSRYAIIYGGAGSGKSYAVPQKIILRILNDWNTVKHKALCIRKYGSNLRQSVYEQCKQVVRDFGLQSLCRFKETTMVIEFDNGSTIICRGLDDPEKLKSITMPTMGWCEEATELDEGDVDQIDLRFRGEMATYYQISFTFNPTSETSWLKAKFFDGDQPDTFILHTTYKDNLFLDKQYKEVLEKRFLSDENMYRIYVKGEWGRIISGTEFYKNFDYTKHVGDARFNPDLPLHISYDFNVHPYMPMGIFQVEKDGERWKVQMIDEIIGKNPDNTTERVTEIFIKKWGEYITQPVFVYGDASGKRRSALTGTINHFDLIARVLGKWYTSQSLRIFSKNPAIANRRLFINKLFNGEYNISVLFDRNCKLMIDDFEIIKIAIDGRKYKQTKKDKITGVSYETHGHFADLWDYFITGCFERLFLDMDL